MEPVSPTTESCVGLPPIRRGGAWALSVWQRSFCVPGEDLAIWPRTTGVRTGSRQLAEVSDVERHRWLSCRRLPDGGCGGANSGPAEPLIAEVNPSNDTGSSRHGAVELLFEAHPAPCSISPVLSSLQAPPAVLPGTALK